MQTPHPSSLLFYTLLAAGALATEACGDKADVAAEQHAGTPADGGTSDDGNALVPIPDPTQDSNVTASLEAKVVFQIDHTTPPVDQQVDATATVGQPLVVEVAYAGSSNPWTFAATGFGNVAVENSVESVAGQQAIGTTKATWQTSQVAAGTYDIVATFQGTVANVATSATVTIHVTLKS